ncbi:MAG: peptide ABC transporter substrate-binding protein [Bdellovibrionales bacterium]|nr:peptide ABC transporter substrate-binding protein [Bdellovibrionales bacterium]
MKKYVMSLCLLVGANIALAAGNPNAPFGGEFKINLGQAPTTLNALSSSDAYASEVQSYIMEGLLTRNIDTREWEPALAKEWSISKDGKTFEFTLRDGVKWQDGKPLTIEDVKFSFDAIMDPKDTYKTAHLKPYFENIKSAEVVAPNKIKFTVGTPYFNNFTVVAGLTIVPMHLYKNPSKEQEKILNKTLVGTGPYILKEFDRAKRIVLTANPNWWGRSAPQTKGMHNFQTITMRFIQDSTIGIRTIENGEIDYLGLNAEEYVKKTTGPKWGKTVQKIKTQNKSVGGYQFVGFNLTNPMFKSVKTREALVALFDRKKMIEKFLFNLSLPATGPLYLQSDYADPSVKPIDFDPKAALKKLNDDGWKDTDGDKILDKMIDGKKVNLSFTILEPLPDFVKYLTTFQEDAKKAGVDVQVKVVEWNAFIKLLDERKFEAVRLAWGGGDLDWDPKQIWHTESIANAGSNFVQYSNPKVDKLIDDARLIMDKKERVTKLREVYRTIAADVPYIFLFNGKFKFYSHTNRIAKEKETYVYGVAPEYWWLSK